VNPIKIALAGACAAVGLTAFGAASAETAQEKANIKTAEAFYDAAINQKDFDKARSYLGDRYTQHNPTAQDGPEGLKGYIAFLKAKFPDQHNEFVRAFADGDYVIIHCHSVQTPGTRGRAIVDIFKLEKGKVVEHWDVIQEVPEKANNTNGMF
jgi:predicted SnoaL-like aldol condensation-catalyzing enzyme